MKKVFLAVLIIVFISSFVSSIVYAEQKSYWTCPMHPEVHMNEPGECPKCGMDLVQVGEDGVVIEPSHNHHDMHDMKMQDAKKPVLKTSEGKVDKEIDYWTCSMHPSVRQDAAGKCPICGMNLIPVYKGEEGSIILDKRTKTLIGIVSQKAEKMTLHKNIKLPGRVVSDPDLYLAQQEYISLLTINEQRLINSAENKLSLFGFDKKDITALKKNRKADKSLIYPDEYAWVKIDIYEDDIANVKKGAQVILTTSVYPEDKFTGKIIAIEPTLDKVTRSAKARIKMKNPGTKLKFEMYLDAELEVALEPQIAVPSAAVIDTGKRTLVYVETEPGRFQLRNIKAGYEAENYKQVLEGIFEDEMVVVKGNFLLDSQTTLNRGQSVLYESAGEIKKEDGKKEEIKTKHVH